MRLEDKNLVYLKELQKKRISENHNKEIERNPHKHWWYLKTDNTAYLRSVHPFTMAADFFRKISPKTVLNLGDSRGGAESVYFKSLGWNSLPCDQITSVLKIAKEEIGFIDNYIEQDAENMFLDSESFDYVITKETLHHLSRPYAAIYEMLRVAKEGIVIIEPRDYNYEFGKENYESCGNFSFGFSLKELAKTFTAMNYPEVCYRYIWEIQPIIDEYGSCGGEKFLKNKDNIQAKIDQWYNSHDKQNGQLLMIFCFKQTCLYRDILEKCGFTFLNIRGNYTLPQGDIK